MLLDDGENTIKSTMRKRSKKARRGMLSDRDVALLISNDNVKDASARVPRHNEIM